MLAAKFVGIVHKQDRCNVEREVEIMCELQHPRLIQLYDAFEANNAMCFILELIEGGELFERVIDDDFILTEKSVTVFMRQICEGVQFIHSKNILHLDLKPENILCLTKTGNRIKIIDFGLARKFNPQHKLQVLFGTPEFVAPEVVNFDAIGFGTDMWSVGVICYVLLSGLSPFMGETDVETMANVTIAQYDFDDEAFDSISNDAKDFIKKLLLKDHKDRMTAAECLSHNWLHKKKVKKTVRKSVRKSVSKKKLTQLEPKVDQEIQPSSLLAHQDSSLDLTKENLKEFCERKSSNNSPADVLETKDLAEIKLAQSSEILSSSEISTVDTTVQKQHVITTKSSSPIVDGSIYCEKVIVPCTNIIDKVHPVDSCVEDLSSSSSSVVDCILLPRNNLSDNQQTTSTSLAAIKNIELSEKIKESVSSHTCDVKNSEANLNTILPKENSPDQTVEFNLLLKRRDSKKPSDRSQKEKSPVDKQSSTKSVITDVIVENKLSSHKRTEDDFMSSFMDVSTKNIANKKFTSWTHSSTTINRRSSDVSYMFSSTTTTNNNSSELFRDFVMFSRDSDDDLLNTSDNLHKMLLTRRQQLAFNMDRKPKFKLSNMSRDVPFGAPPPVGSLLYYVTAACRSAPHSNRTSPERESTKDMFLRFFYGNGKKNSEFDIFT
ncbi:uncharacterized protein LOC126893644 isoform X2 [Daktulosphaira vitifoliae]|nr:uncharacterized protein LOC126893644 isoform X2 [Daktulosphaira vitifoliae]